jgi:osmoprotectant transport system ATP-binding protein
MINGLLYPTRGKVLVQNIPTVNWDPVQLRRRIGYVIQEIGLFPHYTVEENIGLVPRLEGWPLDETKGRVQELLEIVGLDPTLLNRYPHELSGGQKQRVGVARAIAADPPILLMDEPFAAVDPLNRLRIRRKFKEIQMRLGKTTVFVTHDIQEAFDLADKIGLLERGRLVELTSPEGFLRSTSPTAQSFVECLDPRVRTNPPESLKE